jgi:hypothetical protein
MKYRIVLAVRALVIFAVTIQLTYVVLDFTHQEKLIKSFTKELKTDLSYIFR